MSSTPHTRGLASAAICVKIRNIAEKCSTNPTIACMENRKIDPTPFSPVFHLLFTPQPPVWAEIGAKETTRSSLSGSNESRRNKEKTMIKTKFLALAAFAVALFAFSPASHAQVTVGIGVGGPPVCPYGYFDYAPYDCAPYGYYGPDWFTGGLFIGAGPWFHGPRGFYGHVDNRYDPHYGYHGPFPGRGEQPFNHFHGNEARDGRGHIGPAGHDGGHEHALPGYRGGGEHGGHR
jgi:hypothetical protein